ncbi:MAG TPA: hypothetical protein VKR58_07520 [Aquella sp.]|nr:hypothetical protein [Aquella sp.]
MENVLLAHRIEKNKKFNRLARCGYIAAAMIDPYGLISLTCAIFFWMRGAHRRQISGFLINMVIHIVATFIFDIYFNNLTGTLIYSVVFATAIPFILYRATLAPTTQLQIAELAKA